MGSVIGPVLLGLFISALGISNMKGNISSIHWYHRQRVTEENKRPFGKLMGLGTLVIGAAMVVFGILSFVAEKTQRTWPLIVGAVIVAGGCLVGLGMSLYAMFKYNKGIF